MDVRTTVSCVFMLNGQKGGEYWQVDDVTRRE